MLSKLKLSLAAVAAASLFSGVSYGSEPGNVVYTLPSGTGCYPSPRTWYPYLGASTYQAAITLSSATVGSDSYYFITLLSAVPGPGTNGADVNDLVYTDSTIWQYSFDMTTGNYTLFSVGSSGSGSISSTFTGSITSNGFGGLNINLTTSCGATLVGNTAYAGS
jgi:hypothetical protein